MSGHRPERPGAGRAVPHRLARLGVVAVVLGATLVATAAPGQGQGATRPALRLLAQTTWVEPVDQFQLTVALDAPAPPDAEVAVTIHERLLSRSLLERALDGNPGSTLSAFSYPLAELTGTCTGCVDIDLPVVETGRREPDRLRLNDAGVYPVRVELRSAEGEILSGFTTFLTRLFAEPSGAPSLDVALVVPFGSAPALDDDGSARLGNDEQQRLSQLATSLGGHPSVGLTVAPTPETVESLAATAAGQQVLDTLIAALAGRQVVAAPYVDVDLGGMLRVGLERELDAQFTQGAAALEAGLRPVRPDGRTWLGRADTTPAAVQFLRSRNVDQVLLPEAALSPLELTTTLLQPNVLQAGNTPPTPVAVVDGRLSARLAEPGADPVLAAQQVLGELAQLYHDLPSAQRGVVLQAPDDWTVSAPFFDTLLSGLTASTVLRGVTLDQWFADVRVLNGPDAQPVTRTLAGPPPTDLRVLAERYGAVRPRLAGYASMVTPDATLPAALDRRLLVAGSDRLDLGDRLDQVDVVARSIDTELSGIHPPEREGVTLTSRSGEIPIWLRSNVAYPVTITVRLESDKLDFPDGAEHRVTLAEGRTKVDFKVRARASGTFPLRIVTTSPDGQVMLGEARSTVRSTAVSGVGAVLSIGAVLFLAVWWAKHLRTTRLNRRLVAARAGHPSGDATQDPGQPRD